MALALQTVVSAGLLIMLVACGQSPDSPTPTFVDSPSQPTSASSSVEERTVVPFAQAIANLDSAAGDLTGSLHVAATVGEVTGELRFDEADTYVRIVVELPGQEPQTSETVTVEGVRYNRHPGGMWLESAPQAGEMANPLDISASSPEVFVDRGPASIDGETLHRLEHREGPEFDASTFGLTDPAISDFSADLVFLAEPDGTPAGFSVEATWTQPAGDVDVPVDMDLSYRFTSIGSIPPVKAPKEVWRMHESARLGYRMAYPLRPDRWDVDEVPEEAEPGVAAHDLFLGPISEEVQVYAFDVEPGVLPNQWFRGSIELLEQNLGPVEVVEQMELAGGLPVQILSARGEDDFGSFVLFEAVVFAGDRAWDIDWYSDAANDGSDVALLRDFLSTFQVMPSG